jgi:hypothetical protein
VKKIVTGHATRPDPSRVSYARTVNSGARKEPTSDEYEMFKDLCVEVLVLPVQDGLSVIR